MWATIVVGVLFLFQVMLPDPSQGWSGILLLLLAGTIVYIFDTLGLSVLAWLCILPTMMALLLTAGLTLADLYLMNTHKPFDPNTSVEDFLSTGTSVKCLSQILR